MPWDKADWTNPKIAEGQDRQTKCELPDFVEYLSHHVPRAAAPIDPAPAALPAIRARRITRQTPVPPLS